MPSRTNINRSFDAGNRSSIFLTTTSRRRDLWWTAFRRTVLDPYGIILHNNTVIERVPEELLNLVEAKYENLERHEEQAVAFAEAVATYQGFGPSPIFPPDVVPDIPEQACLSRCLEPVFSTDTIPSLPNDVAQPLFQIPAPRPSLVSGFPSEAFSGDELKEMPDFLTSVGCLADYASGQIQPDRTIHVPFLLFERTYGNMRHELEASANYCAMSGAAALNGVNMLFHRAWAGFSPQSLPLPVVFTCTIDNDLAIINHHWVADDGALSMAPLCKFDFRDQEHFMHFLAWIEAIEEWATRHLHVEIRRALGALAEQRAAGVVIGTAKALPSPFTDEEKQEKLSHSMKLAFENIPWKGDRPRNTPLGATMRMRSPRVAAETDSEMTPTTASKVEEEMPRRDLSISLNGTQSPPITTPSNTAAMSPPQTAPFPAANTALDVQNFSKSTPSSPAVKVEKKRRAPASILSIKSAALQRSAATSPTQRPTTAVEPQTGTSISTVASSQTVPIPRSENAQSPGIITSTVEMKSPSRSVISISSKKSFKSLRSAKSLRSPGTPDSNTTPKSSGFKSKITNGLDAIKERTTPRRPRAADNSAPSSAKEVPIPTPAYDKKRFEIRPPAAPVPPTPKFWEQVLRPTSNNQAAATAAYNASHVLPFRQYAKSPAVATIATTITAGGSN